MNNVMGIVNLSESSEHIADLTQTRTTAAIPLLGRYRVIDFTLSNMVNSGINNIAIFTQGRARSLTNHLGSGKHWGLDRKRDGLYVFHPETDFGDNIRRTGDLENFRNHLDYLKYSNQDFVILSRSYMICNIDYRKVVRQHVESGADITLVYKNMENSVRRFYGCDSLTLDDHHTIKGVGTNLGKKRFYDISMEMYVLKRDLLIKIIEEAVHRGEARFLKEAIFTRFDDLRIKGYAFDGYLACINSTQNYYLTNMDLLNVNYSKELFHNNGRIYTKVMDAPSTKYADNSYVSNSLIANGCIIEGTVENSILCRDVHVKKGAIIRNSIVLPNAIIHETTNLNYTILDKNVVITERKMLFGDSESPFVIKKNTVL